MRRPPFATALAFTAMVLLTATAVAGGWATIVLDDTNGPPTAGQPTTLGFTMWQHARTKVSWPKATITFRRDGSSQAVVVDARPQGPTGHYVADVTLPTAGDWTMTMTSDLVIDTTFQPLTVAAVPPAVGAPAVVQPAAPVAAPAAVAPAAPAALAPAASNPTTSSPRPAPDVPPIVIVALIASLALLLALTLSMGRRRTATGS
jgi:hypothetical protein